MADADLDDLTLASLIADDDKFYLVQSGFSRAVRWSVMKQYSGTLVYRTVTASSDSVLSDDQLIYVQPPVGGTVLTLPLASTVDGKVFEFRNLSAGSASVTLETQDTDEIERATSFTLTAGEPVRIHCDGVDYWIL